MIFAGPNFLKECSKYSTKKEEYKLDGRKENMR
jgi:hypothetical protein